MQIKKEKVEGTDRTQKGKETPVSQLARIYSRLMIVTEGCATYGNISQQRCQTVNIKAAAFYLWSSAPVPNYP